MRICDRCAAPACDELTLKVDDQRFDLCESCRQVVLETLTNRPVAEYDLTAAKAKPSHEKKKGRSNG